MRTSSVAIAVGTALVCMLLAGPALAQDIERGEDLYPLCTMCHGENGAGNAAYLAPAIAGLPEWYVERQLHNFKDGIRGAHFDDIGGMRMRPMALTLRTDEDLKSVAAYVAAMPLQYPIGLLEGGDATKGAEYFATCAACHGQNGEGMQVLNAPPLAANSDWYLKTQLQHYKAGIRGGDPRDAIGMQMRPMAYMLVDDQAILDVLAYIQTLKHD